MGLFTEEYEDSKNEALNLAGIKADSLIESFDQKKIREAEFSTELTTLTNRQKPKPPCKEQGNFCWK